MPGAFHLLKRRRRERPVTIFPLLSLLYRKSWESSRKRKSVKRNIHSITVLIKQHCSSCGQPDPIPAEASRKAMLFSENSIVNKKEPMIGV